jgi:three-Cys-motif partner protein
VAQLEGLQQEFGGTRSIEICKADCTTHLRMMVSPSGGINWTRNRAVVFLDPFGMQVPWDLIACLAQTKAIEVFLNFPVGMAIQRLLFRQGGRYSDAQRQKLDEYFGSDKWADTLYERTLFDDQQSKIEGSGNALLKWYRGRLADIFDHVSEAELFTNTKGGHLYYLMLATPDPTGAKIANHIFTSKARKKRR